MRFIHAAREFNQEHGTALRSIALFTEPDRHAMFVREADEAVFLGPAQMLDPITKQRKSSYLDYERLERALISSRADAVWVGWGFVADQAAFADLCREMGIVFIGPDPDAMRCVGDRIAGKKLAEGLQIPVGPWSGGAVETVDDARHHAERMGYSLLIKAASGGGGHGIRRVGSASELQPVFESARSDAFKTFGDPTVFFEQLLPGARHVEVQVVADHHGTTWAVGVCDCSIQRRHQKVLEEAPSPVLSAEQDRELRDTAVRLSRAAGYCNAGTVEFLYQPETRKFSFIEINPRLQVEHPVTERTTGLDLVKLQIHIARGGRLEGEVPATTGHAIEVRLKAEDADNDFAPASGTIERFRFLSGPGVRIDTGFEVGDVVPPEFDPMLAKIVAFGRNRDEALSRLQRALRDSVIVIRGGTSNRAFLLELVSRPEVKRSEVNIGWLDRLAAKKEHLCRSYADIALIHAAIEAYESERRVEQAQFYASALRGRPEVRKSVGHQLELRYGSRSYAITVYRLGVRQYRLEVSGSRIDAQIDRVGRFEYWLTVGDNRHHIVSVEQGSGYRMEVDGVAHLVERGDVGIVRASSPAVVTSIAVKPGDVVATGDRLAVLEAMKMEMQVVAPFDGKVRQVMAIPNVQVSPGTPLIQIDPTAGADLGRKTDRLSFAGLAAPTINAAEERRRHNLEELRQLMLGFDVSPERTKRLLAEWNEWPAIHNDGDIGKQEDEILNIFVDICSLFRTTPKHTEDAEEAPSTEAHLFSYLRMLDTQGENLPADFLAALRRAVAHYGITTLDRSSELEESLLWMYKSHQRLEQQISSIVGVLERRLQAVCGARQPTDEAFRNLLDRMVSNARVQFPAVSDLARELRYRCCDEPLFNEARRKIYRAAEETLHYLDANPSGPEQREKMRSLIECPQPLAALFAPRFASATPRLQQLMLEVLILRYYSFRKLTNTRTLSLNGFWCVASEYQEPAKRVHIFASHADYRSLAERVLSVTNFTNDVPAQDDVVLDLMAWSPEPLGEADSTSREIQKVLSQVPWTRTVSRIVVSLSGPGGEPGPKSMQHFTYEPGAEGYEEVPLFRGTHPMMSERLHLWRLQNFDVTRQPSPDEIFLLHAVGRDNPKDERLFAMAEVRDLTPVRDRAGRIVQLPYLERMFAEAVAAMRTFQAKRDPRKRLYWNRIFLYVWPTLALKPEEVNEIAHRLAPQTDGLGLEQVVVRARIPNPRTGELRETILRVSAPGDAGLLVTYRPAARLQPLKTLGAYDQKVVKMRQRGLLYPYEIIKMLAPSAQDTRSEFPAGEFLEMDLDAEHRLVPVERAYGENKSNVIAGLIRNFTTKYPEGMERVILLGDPSKDMGAIAEPECRRILAAFDLAHDKRIPLEWFTLSAGAKISMDSGVENMDWIARVLRKIIEFTQAGGEINLVVNGINVGAQPYWNAECTMLMHTKGILIMTPKAAMVLTGKRALDYSGSVSAEDNYGIGGYDRIMGFNGQAQYFARDIDDGCRILMQHYEHAYVAPGERFPRRAVTSDPLDRDVRFYPHGDSGSNTFSNVGEIFSDETNPGRKKSFDIRKVMLAVSDQDHEHLERWAGMRSAETTVVWDAHLGGYPVCLIGIQSKPVPRFGFVPADGPEHWTAGTLFPLSSKKVARAINSASNNRPVVILANLSGFDGSPESMRRLQLEYGAEIGRAVTNFKGPMVFCVVSRYHGGAYVVFSRALNESLEVFALEGTYASVIGGAPAAAVVFAGEVENRAHKDVRMQALEQAINKAEASEKGRLRAEYNELFKLVHSEKLGEVAAEFDSIHSVQRALEVGALNAILPPRNLRPFLIEAVDRGMNRWALGPAEFREELQAKMEGEDVSDRHMVAGTD